MQPQAPTLSHTVPEEANPVAKTRIYTAPTGTGISVCDKTLLDLLDEACDTRPNTKALNQRAAEGWLSVSTLEFRTRSEDLALGLLALGLARGERVALFTESDLSFCLPDMACLTAGLVDVPMYLTHTRGAIKHILNQTEASTLIVTNETLLAELAPLLTEVVIRRVIMFQAPEALPTLPEGISFHLVEELEATGKAIKLADAERLTALKAQIHPNDLATLIYTSGTTGMPKGVMLSHRNIASNVIASMTGLEGFQRGEETAISFLPLTHIFARSLQYALMWYGTSIYYSHPDTLSEDLKEVKPTFFASVPRVLEKAYEKILLKGSELTGLKHKLFAWALELAQQYETGTEPSGSYKLQLAVADKLVLSKWREALGGRIHTIIVGGAAMRADLVNTFGAAGINILQGYGLTETSPVITYSRPQRNRAGVVGEPLAGVEVKIAEDGEILTRGPHVMLGYYLEPDKTAEVMDGDWFKTGDMGEFTAEGYLKITGRIKNLFKLSTGKYVMPQPLEDVLEADPLVAAAIVVGNNEKHCAALLFVEPGLAGKLESHLEQLISLVRQANADLPHWSTIKKIAIIPAELTPENGLLTPKLSVKRNLVLERFAPYLEALYGRGELPAEGCISEV